MNYNMAIKFTESQDTVNREETHQVLGDTYTHT